MLAGPPLSYRNDSRETWVQGAGMIKAVAFLKYFFLSLLTFSFFILYLHTSVFKLDLAAGLVLYIDYQIHVWTITSSLS